ncbi:hypothetical protein [Deinococcus depolymerans]
MTRPRSMLPPVESRLTGVAHPRNQLKRQLKKELATLTTPDTAIMRPSLWLSVTAVPFVLHVAVRHDTTLEDMDAFLREIWMECCGHLSEFESRPTKYETITYRNDSEEDFEDDELDTDSDEEELSDDESWDDYAEKEPERSDFPVMSDDDWEALRTRLSPGAHPERPLTVTIREAMDGVKDLRYEYDMGTTTRCVLKVEAELTLPWPEDRTVRLLARNARPDWVCRECAEPATHQCIMGECWEDGYAKFCAKHARTHPRKAHPREGGDAWMIAPLSNSPRDPCCGYFEHPSSEEDYVW